MYQGDKYNAWVDYYTYGGMPVTLTLSSHEQKSQYLKDLFTRTYLKDVVERHAIQNDTEVLEDLLNIREYKKIRGSHRKDELYLADILK